MKALLAFFIAILFISGCQDKSSIDAEKLVKIYSEMVILQDTSALNQTQIRDTVLSEFNTSINDYEATIKFFSSEPERWKEFFTIVETYLQDQKEKLTKKQP